MKRRSVEGWAKRNCVANRLRAVVGVWVFSSCFRERKKMREVDAGVQRQKKNETSRIARVLLLFVVVLHSENVAASVAEK